MHIKFSRLTLLTTLLFIFASCSKNVKGSPTENNTGNDETHIVDSKLVGTWLWAQSSDGGSYNSDGTWMGSQYGLARQFTINADGTGTCFEHLYSSLDGNTGLEVNISSKGFFESDGQGHLGYFPLSGTYKSSSGDNRNLSGDEIYDTQTRKGRVILLQKLIFTLTGSKASFQVTSDDNVTDTYIKQ